MKKTWIICILALFGAWTLFAGLSGTESGTGGSAASTNVFTLIPTSYVNEITYDLNTNSGLLYLTNNVNSTYVSFTTNLIGPFLSTGITVETNTAIVTIPADAIGSNGYVYISAFWERRTGSGTMAGRVRWGSGTSIGAQLVFSEALSASNASCPASRELWALNSHTNLICPVSTAFPGVPQSGAPVFLTNSTLQAIPVYFNALHGVASETNILWGATVKVYRQK